MNNVVFAVLIYERRTPFRALKGALSDLSVETYCVKKCSEAETLIAQYQPLMVFVDLSVWVKSFADIAKMAKAADQTFNFVVVASLPDAELNASTIEQGAFTFVAPPFSREALIPVVRAAVMDARDRRESLARVGLARAPT
jgi:DNA-binding NtrC family response regulator